jgi:hypothetical protein
MFAVAVTPAAHTTNAPVESAIPADLAGLAKSFPELAQPARLERSFALAAE